MVLDFSSGPRYSKDNVLRTPSGGCFYDQLPSDGQSVSGVLFFQTARFAGRNYGTITPEPEGVGRGVQQNVLYPASWLKRPGSERATDTESVRLLAQNATGRELAKVHKTRSDDSDRRCR